VKTICPETKNIGEDNQGNTLSQLPCWVIAGKIFKHRNMALAILNGIIVRLECPHGGVLLRKSIEAIYGCVMPSQKLVLRV